MMPPAFLLAAYEPSAQDLGQWLQVFFWGCGSVTTVLGAALAWKKLREKPPLSPAEVSLGNKPLIFKPSEEMATTKFVTERLDRLAAESRERHRVNDEKLRVLKEEVDVRHGENQDRLGEIESKLDQNYRHITAQHAALRDEVRHDMRQELQPVQSKADALHLELQDVKKDVRDQLVANNREAAARTDKVNDRISTVAENMPGKIVELLKTTGHLRMPNGRSAS